MDELTRNAILGCACPRSKSTFKLGFMKFSCIFKVLGQVRVISSFYFVSNEVY